MATAAGLVERFFLLAVLALGALPSSTAAEKLQDDAAICGYSCRLSSTSDEAGLCSLISEQEFPASDSAPHQPPGGDTIKPDDANIDPDDDDGEDEFHVAFTGGDDCLGSCVHGDGARRCGRVKLEPVDVTCNVSGVLGGACTARTTGHPCCQALGAGGRADQEGSFASHDYDYDDSDSDWDPDSDLEEGEEECFPGVEAKYCQPGVEEDYFLGWPRGI